LKKKTGIIWCAIGLVLLGCALLAGAIVLRESALEKNPEVQTVEPTSTAPTIPTTAATTIPSVERKDEDFVRIADYIPSVYVDLKYATTDNFTGVAIYDFTEAYLRYGTVKKLMNAQAILQKQGYALKIWDAFRPPAAQFVLWDVCPDPAYVANPNGGYSSHSRGNTVDVTMVTSDGKEVKMPTGFDDFSAKADRHYEDCTPEETAHAQCLQEAMSESGFVPYTAEWWHFSDTDPYPVEDSFSPPAKDEMVD